MSACGRVGFDAPDGLANGSDGGAADDGMGSDGAVACVAITPNTWLASTVPNDPGSGLPHIASLTVSSDGTFVTDNVSGLVWERDPDPTLRMLADAKTYCAGLSLGGCAEWRVPQMSELATIVDHSQVSPVIDPTAFPSTATDASWWSATFQSSTVNNAWAVRFTNGNSSVAAVGTANHVRCVRSARAADQPPARYVISGGTVHDIDTNLIVQASDDGMMRDAPTAAAYCAGLALGPGTWRLPSIDEMLSVNDWTHATPALDPVSFPSASTGIYWTATTFAGATGVQMILDNDEGIVMNGNTTDTHLVRCVQ
jgi:hypothetical protein